MIPGPHEVLALVYVRVYVRIYVRIYVRQKWT